MADDEVIAKANEEIEEVKFRFTVNKIRNLKEFNSKTFYVGGQPWFITVKKNAALSALSVLLSLKNGNEKKPNHWAIPSCTSIKLLSSKSEQQSQQCLNTVFISKRMTRGFYGFLSWRELMNPENCYVNNDECNFEIKVRAGQVQDLTADNGLKVETVGKCNGGSNRKFRLILNHSTAFLGACSPTFILGNLPWCVFVMKSKEKTNQWKQYTLQIAVQSLYEDAITDWSCNVNLSCKMVSPGSNIQKITPIFKNYDFNKSKWITFLSLAQWPEPTNTGNDFIPNKKIIVELDFNIRNVKGIEVNAGGKCCLNKFGLECAICFGSLYNQEVSSPKCGHMFCKGCIETSIRYYGVCPSCNQDAKISDLRRMFLPLI